MIEEKKLAALEPLRSVFARVHTALEQRGVEARSLTVDELTVPQRSALAGLLGWREVPATPRVRISLAKLDAALRESVVGGGLVDVVTAMFGPLTDRRAERNRAQGERDEVWARARGRVSEKAPLLGWLDDLRAHGRVARAATLARTSESSVLEEALRVVSRLPAGGVLLPVFALDVLGDAHALDAGRPLSALVLRAAAALVGVPPPTNAIQRRRIWADVGVACDSLSADVLTLGLVPVGDDLLARHLREASSEGEPRRITLRELSRSKIALPGALVYVCENPSVVAAAAERLGARTRPLVCVEGVPSTAAIRLLKEATDSGAQVRFHLDFDWAGVRIGNLLLEHLPSAKAWRLGADDYGAALDHRHGALELVGSAIDAVWDDRLRQVMNQRAVAVLEEQVLGDLLHDLAR